MKAELNQITRLRFFVQYLYACHCGEYGEDFISDWNDSALHSLIEAEQEDAFLLLRPISQITDAEALGLCQVLDPEITSDEMPAIQDYKDQLARSFTEFDFAAASNEMPPVRIAWAMEYLRSKGFAVPFMGISVEELVSAGWVKLTEN